VFDILKKEEKEKTNDKNGKEPAESEGTKVSHEIRDDTLNNQTHTDGKKTKKKQNKIQERWADTQDSNVVYKVITL
jgi:hypothetical protein